MLDNFLKRVESLPEEAAKEKIKRIVLGKPLMTWLWDQYDEIVHPDDNDLVYGLTYLLVVEGHEELVWDWILANETKKPMGTGLKVAYQWRATAVTFLAMAKSKDVYGSLDDALGVYNRASDLDRGSKVIVPMKPIRAWTNKQLQNSIREFNSPKGISLLTYIVGVPRYPKTDLGLWEKYQGDFRNQPFSETMKEGNLNIMMLYRPVNPDPYPALEALRSATANPSSLRLSYEKPSILQKMHWQSRRAAGLLRDYGRHSDAEETWQMANAHFGVARQGFTESEKPSGHEIAAANAYGESVKPQKKQCPKWLKQ